MQTGASTHVIFRYLLLITILTVSVSLQGQNQGSNIKNETVSDSISSDSSKLRKRPEKIGNLFLPKSQTFETTVNYDAKDSIKYNLRDKEVVMYGDAKVTYGDIELKAAKITYGFTTNEVLAVPTTDSTGALVGRPVFVDQGQNYGADTIRYNFKTQKGIIKQVNTNIADGHVFGARVKRSTNQVLYIQEAEFCPCEDPEAKTRIHAKKLKVIPNSKVLSSSWVLKLGKIPTPLAFFFGYFPNSTKRNAGIILPRYGDSPNLGFFLADFGWYQPLGEKADLKLMGSVYTKGSWNTSSALRYKNNYRYSGNLDFLYQVSKSGFPELPSTFSKTSDFKINWNHRQDPKARPNSSFNSSVNIGTSTVNRNNIGSNSEEFLTNTFRSNINYSKTFPGKPYNFSASASHSQNTNTGIVNVDLPQFNFNLTRLYLPLSWLKASDNAKTMWYEKIGVNYAANFSNRVSAQEEEFSLENWNGLRRKMQNGIRHNANVSTSLKKFFFTINPSFNITNRTYFRKIERSFSNELQAPVTDTLPGFYNVFDYGFSTSVTTNVYGMYTFKKGPVKAIRHLMTPSASFFYRPGFDYRQYGFVGTDGAYTSYTPFDGQIFGVPNPNHSGGVSINLQNNVEAKVINRKDTTGIGTKKIKLLEAFNLGTNHDFLRDSIKWSNINLNARTTILKSLSLNYSANLDPYGYNESGQKIDEALITQRGKLVRFANQTFALNYSYRPGMYKEGNSSKTKTAKSDTTILGLIVDGIKPEITLGYNYSVSQVFQDGGFNANKTPHTISISGSFDFFEKVKLRYTTGYDFIQKKTSFTQFNLYVDLNCWEFSASFVPFGNIKSYSVALNMKSNLLRDLKLERNRTFNENTQF
ncbi:putative LPS assembly protein LptD [Luteibaculum oceani]|uniref:LPS-assembly protein LptD n=1 Tax=Luteibaculum oceani TaxID=1294296 RepID=A0A5C6VEC8_9FLAO|nr:putative LPS assembly protein LptD [Luteibaculum oceani]TXC81448.1 LPS-assembly protein LptD [Luteibaculum oceani]